MKRYFMVPAIILFCNFQAICNDPIAVTALPSNDASSKSILGLSGNYLIGGTGTTPSPGCSYVDLTAAFADLATNGVSGPVTLILTSTYSASEENAFPIVIGEYAGTNSTNTITVRPDASVSTSISATSSTSILKINGGDHIIIDGSNNGTNSRNLTFSNTRTSTNSAVIWIASTGTGAGAHHVTIKNCLISAGTSGSSSINTFGIYVAGTSISKTETGDDNDNLTIHNNLISKAFYGIYAVASSSGVNDNLVISADSIGSSSAASYVIGYGIYLKQCSGSSINGNTIFNMITSAIKPIGLVAGSGVVSSTVSGNRINGLKYTGTGNIGGTGLEINTGISSSGLTIANNLVYDISGTGNNVIGIDATTGIRILGSTGGIEVCYNSVNLFGTYAKAITNDVSAAFYLSTSITSTINMRNNIFRNSIENTASTAKAYAIYTFWNGIFGTIDHNDYYVEGPEGQLGHYYLTDITTLTQWKSATGQDANSISADPVFGSPTNLKVDYSSPVLNAGTPIAGVTNDFENVTRSLTTPSMGAYENGTDMKGPQFSYTPLITTTSTSSRTLTVTITDYTGVPTNGIGLPVLYWKINSGAWNSATATSTGANGYQFTFGNGVTANDVVYYYLVAQDLVTTPNVSASPSAGATGFTVNPPACSTPPTTPNSYRISEALSGTVTVGTGGNYTSLTGNTGLFKKINDNILTGNMTIQIISNLTEDGTNGLNQWLEEGSGNYTITIQPDGTTERLISGNTATALIRLDGADRVIIDGRYGGNGLYLRFRNINTGNATIHLLNGATNNTLRNCYFEGASTASTYGTIYIGASTGSTGNSNNSILYNMIRDRSDGTGVPNIAVYSYGTNGKENHSNTIANNDILNFTNYGILVGSVGNGSNWNISNNSVYNNLGTPSSTTMRGISIIAGTSSVNNTISGNYIGGQAALCGGSSWNNNGDKSFTGINVSVGSSAYSTISSNTIQNISLTNANARDFIGINLDNGYAYITGNTIGHPTDLDKSIRSAAISYALQGIRIISSYFFTNVEYNTITNLVLTATDGYPEAIGIYVYAANLRKNKISGIGYCTSSSSSFFPYIYGILMYGLPAAENEISNNVIILDGGLAADPEIFGYLDYSYSNNTYSLFYNSISITGPATASMNTYAFFRDTDATYELKDNVFANFRESGGIGINYAVYFYNPDFLDSDYNDLFCPNGMTGYYNYTDLPTLSDWQAETSQDANSIGSDPVFVSNSSDLHPGDGSTLIAAGTAIPDLDTDIENNPRNATNPSIGAYETNPAIATKIWNGSASIAWNNGGNWTPSGVPVSTDNVVIHSGAINSCTLNSSGLECKNININTGSAMTIDDGSDITIYGNLIIQNSGSVTNSGFLNLKGNLMNFNAGN